MSMKELTPEIAAPFMQKINDICNEYGVVITAHCIWGGYGKDGLASHCISNAPNHNASAAQLQEAIGWYRDGKLREHMKQ